jgi:hypothetical protein
MMTSYIGENTAPFIQKGTISPKFFSLGGVKKEFYGNLKLKNEI